MFELLHRLPLWVSGPLIVVSLCAYGILGLRITRRYILPRIQIDLEDSVFSAGILGGVMIFYSLAVALIAIHVWETYSDISKIVSQEATSLAGLYRDASGYPEPKQSELQLALSDYTQYIIGDVWPLQAKGEVPAGGVAMVNQFQTSLIAFEPTTEGQKLLHAETLRAYSVMIQERRMRLDAVTTHLPGVLWIIIILGSLISISSTFFFKVIDPRLHELQVIFLSTFIGLITIMVFAFESPFQGDLALSSEPFQLVYDQLMKK